MQYNSTIHILETKGNIKKVYNLLKCLNNFNANRNRNNVIYLKYYNAAEAGPELCLQLTYAIPGGRYAHRLKTKFIPATYRGKEIFHLPHYVL